MDTSVDPLILSLYSAFDLIGVVLNGIIGGTIARRREFDFVGFVFLALLSALGGGMIRDMLIGQGTAAAIANPAYLSLACVGALIAFLLPLSGKAWELFKVHADALILGFWSITGCVKALSFDMPLISCVFMGLLTAVGGGMVRDVVSGMTPGIFGGSPLYAVPAIVASVAMVCFATAGYTALGMMICPAIGAGLAITAYWRGWILPTNNYFARILTPRQLARRDYDKQAKKNARRARRIRHGSTTGRR